MEVHNYLFILCMRCEARVFVIVTLFLAPHLFYWSPLLLLLHICFFVDVVLARCHKIQHFEYGFNIWHFCIDCVWKFITCLSGNNYQVSTSLTPMAGGLHVCYYQKANESLQIGVELEGSLRTQECTTTVGYQLELPKANLTFRGISVLNFFLLGDQTNWLYFDCFCKHLYHCIQQDFVLWAKF